MFSIRQLSPLLLMTVKISSSSTQTTTTNNNPITFSYEAHVGPVQGLDFSPSHRNLFLSCSTDATSMYRKLLYMLIIRLVRIYHLLKSKPLVIISPSGGYLFGVGWSPSRPLVFAAASDDGNLYLYDLLVGIEFFLSVSRLIFLCTA